jgi:hypothetical protein
MIKFEEFKAYNFLEAIYGMRNSYESWDKIDSYEVGPMDSTETEGKFILGPNDKVLMMKLAKAGPEHAKFLRQVMVSVRITAPLKWWDEMDTYHFFETNSTSAMHTLGKDIITSDKFSFEDFDDDVLDCYMDLINVARKRWINSGKKKPSREWRQLIMLTAMGFNYKRTWTSNYSQLRTIYFQRRFHRLQEWRDMAAWIESLPYSELITMKVDK